MASQLGAASVVGPPDGSPAPPALTFPLTANIESKPSAPPFQNLEVCTPGSGYVMFDNFKYLKTSHFTSSPI